MDKPLGQLPYQQVYLRYKNPSTTILLSTIQSRNDIGDQSFAKLYWAKDTKLLKGNYPRGRGTEYIIKVTQHAA